MGLHFPETKPKAHHEYHFLHKIRPIFFLPSNKEFQPPLLCATCFPSSDSKNINYENLGVRNLLTLDHRLNEIVKLSKTLSQEFHSIQVHQDQIEHLIKQNSIKVFLTNYQNASDQQILTFTLGMFQEYPQFNQNLPDIFISHSTNRQFDKFSHVIFLNIEDADQQLDALLEKLRPYSNNSKIEFIPTSISYESHPTFSSRKSNVRINFGQAYSFEDIIQLQKADESAILIFKKHVRHDVWRNTAIMPLHVISVLNYYKCWRKTAPSTYISIMKEFHSDYLSYYDRGYIGNYEDIVNYCFLRLAADELSSKSIALDLLKYQSMMMISLLSIVNLHEKDIHSEIIQIYESKLFEKFRMLTRILSNEVVDIYPPCTTSSVIEKHAVESLVDSSVVSYHDGQECETHEASRKLAKHLDLDFEEDFNSDWVPVTRPEIIVYVNVENLLSRKWISNIATSLLEIYYVTARNLLELQKVEILEYGVFLSQVEKDFNETFTLQTVSHFESTVQNAIDLFQKEGVVSVQNSHNVKLLFLNDPLNNQNVLQLINDIAEFIMD